MPGKTIVLDESGTEAGRAPKLVFVEEFFYPEGWGGAELPRDLTIHLARRGFRVEVICGSHQYVPAGDELPPDPRAEGVRIRRIRDFLGDPYGRLGKLARQIWFCLLLVPLLLLRRPPDMFVCQTNPPLAVPIVALAARLWRKPCLIIAMDLYPEVLIAHGALAERGVFARVLHAVFRWAYGSASRVVVLGPAAAERVRSKGVMEGSTAVIPNWATGPSGVVRGIANRMRAQLGLGDCFVLVYSGNLGLSHEFATLLQGFASAAGEIPELRLVFIGGGARLAEVRGMVRQLKLDNRVIFADFVPASRLPEAMGLADMGVMTLRDGFAGLVVPSKLTGYMSRGIPVLYIGPPSDAEHFVSQHGCGFVAAGGDPGSVTQAILNGYGDRQRLARMGDAGLAAYRQEFSRESALAKYEVIVQACLGSEGDFRR